MLEGESGQPSGRSWEAISEPSHIREDYAPEKNADAQSTAKSTEEPATRGECSVFLAGQHSQPIGRTDGETEPADRLQLPSGRKSDLKQPA
jgi:hypothetical protein